MEIMKLSFIIYFYCLILLHLITSTSGQFTVAALRERVLVSLGGEAELSCQLSPPQSAEHMEIRWFRNRYTQPVHLYKNGKDIYGETVYKYVERTDLLKEDIGEGKVTIRIFNVSVDDDGPYHCLYQDGDFYDEAIIELKVTATSAELQIRLYPPNTKGVLVECNSGGWFPQPQMEWRDDRGMTIPPTSESYSQNEDKVFHMKIELMLSSLRNVTCYIQNPLTGQEEMISLILSDTLFPWYVYRNLMVGGSMLLLAVFILVPSVELQHKLTGTVCKQYVACIPGFLQKRKRTDAQSLNRHSCKDCFWSPFVVGVLIYVLSVFVSAMLMIYLRYKSRVPDSDPHSQLDKLWLDDITVILYILLVFITMVISFFYFKIRDILLV